ncbi:hypothetical protein GN244_ATG20816 [Phytophthora infestans]|uniref:No apical meristem-associated C-terminal domain-containing protein n=1 Tax=Phytophthora infestans TaxID=4787 RepID=A0A833SFX2_PHYIN|nr:hypothetical protein GN244_ATG20816 [Phytophthora infestans]KAI9998381.1 hypothetical protein PInf_002768 [Phytophthora infestans]
MMLSCEIVALVASCSSVIGTDCWRRIVYYLHKWCEHRGSGREFCAADLYPDNEDDSQREGMTQDKKINRKRRKSSQSDALSSVAESVAQIVANQTSEAQEATWAEHTLLLRDQRVAHKLEMLSGKLQRTTEEGKRLAKKVREFEIYEHDDSDDEGAHN